MSQWNRTTAPTELDADEWENILVMDDNGRKAVYNWQDYNEDGMQEDGWAWMTLPTADDVDAVYDVDDEPEPISIVITAGDRQVAIFKNGYTIEVHTSEDPMGQPAVWEDDLGGIDGLLATVEAVLTEDLMRQVDDDDDATYQYNDGEPVAVNDTELQGMIDAITGKTPQKQESCQCKCNCRPQSDWEFGRHHAW